jgi:hypothetical protein
MKFHGRFGLSFVITRAFSRVETQGPQNQYASVFYVYPDIFRKGDKKMIIPNRPHLPASDFPKPFCQLYFHNPSSGSQSSGGGPSHVAQRIAVSLTLAISFASL